MFIAALPYQVLSLAQVVFGNHPSEIEFAGSATGDQSGTVAECQILDGPIGQKDLFRIAIDVHNGSEPDASVLLPAPNAARRGDDLSAESEPVAPW